MAQVWRPTVPISIDGQALTVSIADFIPSSFPYSRLPSDSVLVAPLLRPDVALGLCAAYLASKPALARLVETYVGGDGRTRSSSSTALVCGVAAHNLILAIFSAVVLVNSWPVVLMHLFDRGWEATYCDQDGSLWDNGLGGWVVIFYVSKYYEFVDTWVLILKGKNPSFLQTYHHVGIVLTMWAGVTSKSAWLLIVVLLNSGIHTAMYTYFFIKTLYPKREIRAARNLTSAQIVQFVTGIAYVSGLHYLGDGCDTPASRFAALVMQSYGMGLIFLFVSFASKKYKQK